ncbi:MAG: ATP-binding cassette domain-containing protein [Herbinix sp.]|nr:ATP-binding cassette domain-containing protein [Herbinix sp.]
MAICKVKDLNKTYKKQHNVINAIVKCNIEISAGECVAISGIKASGKTTLLRLLGGLERPTSGEVYINHHNITTFSDDELAIMRRDEIGYVFQNDSLIPELTVQENIILPTRLTRKKQDMAYYHDVIERLHINEVLPHYPNQLTINQMQSVIYARALVNNPKIIIVDEPSGFINQHIDKEILDFLLNTIYQYNKTLIMVTNDSEVSIFVDHIIRLKDGEIVEDRRIS